MVKMGLGEGSNEVGIHMKVKTRTGYEIFDGSPWEEDNVDDEWLEEGIRKIDIDINQINPEILAIVNTQRTRAMELLLKRGWEYTPGWTKISRSDKKPRRRGETPQFTFESSRDNISLHIPGLEIQTLRKRKPENHVLYDIRITLHGELSEFTLSHKEYNLLKKFVSKLGDTIKIINKDRYTLRDLISSIGTGIIGKIEGENLYGIPVNIPKPVIAADAGNKSGEPEYIRRFGRMVKNPEYKG